MVANEANRVVLGYEVWQRWAAFERLLAFWLLLGVGFVSLFAGNLFALPLVVLLGLYGYATAIAPLLRLGLRVSLEPGGLRMGGRFYAKEGFSGVEGPLGSWTRWEVWPGVLHPYRLHLGWRFSRGPLFYMVFGEERVPLWLDLPGWDRMLAHLGLDWREHPGLRRYLLTARGLAWLNGLLYPPAGVGQSWREARDRYRRVGAWLWAGAAFLVLGAASSFLALFVGPVGLLGAVGVPVGVVLLAYQFLRAFNIGRGRPGWAVAYNPLGALEG